MTEKLVDVMQGRVTHSVLSEKITHHEVNVDRDRFVERRRRANELINGLLDVDQGVRDVSRTGLETWFKGEVGDGGPENVTELKTALTTDSFGGRPLSETDRANFLEMYYSCVMAEVSVVQEGLGDERKSSLIRSAAINLRGPDWADAELVSEAFDNAFGSTVLVGGAREVADNLVTSQMIIRQLERLDKELEFGFNSRDIDKRLREIEKRYDDGDVPGNEYNMVWNYLLELRSQAKTAEDKSRGRGLQQRTIRPIGQDAGEAGPGGSDEYMAGLYELEFSDFLETAVLREQVPWRIENRPQWYKDAGPVGSEERLFFDATRKLTDGSSWFQFYQNADLEKCWHNPSFKYSGKEMNALMNDDFKAVSHWMLNDLCIFEITSDGVERLVYKPGKDGVGIDAEVMGRIANMREYQQELALRLAKAKRFAGMSAEQIAALEARKPTEASEMDQLIACNAWNMFFMTFGSSLADRDRVLAPNDGKVSDKIRTLNSEAKSRKKLQIFNMGKGVEMTGDNGSLLEAEWFGGGVSAWVEMVLTIEDATGKPMDGKKTLRQKIIDKDMWFFDSPLLYSFYDTKEVEVDKLNDEGRSVPLMKDGRLMFDENGKPRTEKEWVTIGRALYEGREFHFENNENDTMSDFRDITEAAVRTWTVLVGKSQIKSNSLRELTNELRSSVGLLSQLKLKGKLPGRISRVVTTPEFWGMCLVNTFGPNMDVLSSDGIYVKGAISSASYPEFLTRLYNHLQLNDFVNPKLYKKFLKGDGGIFGRTKDRIGGMIRNQSIDQVFRKKWQRVEAYYEANRVDAEAFASKEKIQVAKWYNRALENGDTEAAERFKKILDNSN